MEKSMNQRIEALITKKIDEFELVDFMAYEDIKTLEVISKIYEQCENRKAKSRPTSVYTKQSNEDLEKEFV
jgi:hypothetical protein